MSTDRDTGTPTDTGTNDAGTTDTGARDTGAGDTGGQDAGPADTGPGPANPDCDPIMPEVCSFPWPSSLYLVEDQNKDSGYALTFGATSLPQNSASPPSYIDVEPWNRLDGYGVGTPIMVLFPNLDSTNMPGEQNIEDSMDANAQIILMKDEGQGVTRIPYWVDHDIYTTDYENPNPPMVDPAERVLFIQPAEVLDYSSRYFVVFRNLRDLSGNEIAPSPAFARLVSGDTANDPQLAPRQARFDRIFQALEQEGIAKEDVTLAWDFTTGSSQGIHGRMLHMRDEALQAVGPMGPEITITSTQAVGPGDRHYPYIAYEVQGTIRVPNYLTDWFLIAVRHTVLNYGPDDMPEQDGWREAPFWARIPRSVLSATVTSGLLQHGHGQLGSGEQIVTVGSGRYYELAHRYRYILFACDLIGMSEAEELPLGISLGDFSGFRWVGDTLHQGMLDSILLARAFKNRFANDPWVQTLPLNIDTDDIRYFGISQGGIFGASFLALSPDIERGHLGVGGVNYSTILQRSRNFTPFFEMLAPNYPRRADQGVILALAQLLFDGTESISYVRAHGRAAVWQPEREPRDHCAGKRRLPGGADE